MPQLRRPVESASRPSFAPVALAATVATAALLSWASRSDAYPFQPPSGYAGNPPFGEDCSVCHYSYDVNSGNGSLDLLGVPTPYLPGQTYPLTVLLSDPGQVRWGFEVTVLDDAYPDDPTQGGDLLVTDAVHTQVDNDYYVTDDYLGHTEVGTFAGVADGPVSWSFSWTAPGPEVASVTFYVVGNAANGNEAFTGDYIYKRSYQTYPDQPNSVDLSTWGKIKALYSKDR